MFRQYQCSASSCGRAGRGIPFPIANGSRKFHCGEAPSPAVTRIFVLNAVETWSWIGDKHPRHQDTKTFLAGRTPKVRGRPLPLSMAAEMDRFRCHSLSRICLRGTRAVYLRNNHRPLA